MAFTQRQKDQIIAAIKERASGLGQCPVCRHPTWTLADGVVRLALQEKPGALVLGGRGLPCVALICANCGNTQLLNILTLGIGPLLGYTPGESASAGTEEE